MTGDETGLVVADQIGALDRIGAEAQMADGHGTGFLGVVLEIALTVVGRLLGDDLDRVLIGRDGTVRAESVEDAGRDPLQRVGLEVGIPGQTGVADIVEDADGKGILGLIFGQFVEDRLDHRGREFLGTQAIASADDARHGVEFTGREGAGERSDDIFVERLAIGARFLGAIEHGEARGRRGQGGDECAGIEGAEQPDLEQSDFLAACGQMLDCFFSRTQSRAHQHHHALGVRRADVLEQPVLASGQGGEAVHDALHDTGRDGVIGVDGLAALEIDIRVLRGAAQLGMIRIQGALAMGLDPLFVDQGADGLDRQALDLVDLVRGAEAIEEVQEGQAAFERGGLGDERKIHRLLHRTGTEHGITRCATGHDVRVIAEDRQGLSRQRACRDMEDRRGQFPGDLVHIRNHQQQTLRGGEGGRERSALECAVDGPGGTALALHLHDIGDRAPQIPDPQRGPFIRPFAHVGGGRDGIDGDDLIGQVRDVSGGLVAVEYDQALVRHRTVHWCGWNGMSAKQDAKRGTQGHTIDRKRVALVTARDERRHEAALS
jgi:hypothetical protein